MALVPKISLSISNSCNKVDVWENTGVFVTGVDETGWGTSNVDTSNVQTAILTVYDYTGTNLVATIVLKDYPLTFSAFALTPDSPYNTAFKALSNVTWNNPDGIYKLVYTVTDISNVVYTNKVQYQLFTCNLCNCMQGLMQKMLTQCSGKKLDKYKDVYDQLELLKYGIESAFSCNDFTKVNNLLTNASTMCTTFSECGCGCDEC